MSTVINAPITVVTPTLASGVTVVIPTLNQDVNVGPTNPRFSLTLNNSMAGFTLPLVSTSTYDFAVFWGDGTADRITTWNQAEATHNYPSNASFTLTILDGGTMPRWAFNNGGSRLKVLSLNNWGAGKWTSLSGMFSGCSNLTSVASGGDFSLVTTYDNMFLGCSSLTSAPPISYSTGTSFGLTFQSCTGLTTIPAIDFVSGISFTSIFRLCSNITTIGACNFHGGTLANSFDGCTSLSSILATGISQDVDFTNCNMNAAALNALFTNLSTVVGKTITITGNPGEATSTKTIATGKGWTVVPP